MQRIPLQDAAPLVSCFWCERLHPGKHPLSVCGVCAARFSTMRSLGMNGPYPLTDEAIDDAVARRSPGNFALGYMDGDSFRVFFVGCSESDVKRRLHEWVGRPSHFTRHASSAKAPWSVHHRGLLPVDAPAFGSVGNAESSYTCFAYSFASSSEAAFDQECRNYADFGGRGGLDNAGCPVRAIGAPGSASRNESLTTETLIAVKPDNWIGAGPVGSSTEMGI